MPFLLYMWVRGPLCFFQLWVIIGLDVSFCYFLLDFTFFSGLRQIIIKEKTPENMIGSGVFNWGITAKEGIEI